MWHLLGASSWPWERSDLFKSKWKQGLGCFGEAPTKASTDQQACPPWMPSLLKGIITRQRLNYLVLFPVVWRVSFMIEHEFCMAADISKILAMGELSSRARHRLGKQTFCFIRVLQDHVWHGELLKAWTLSLFIKQNASPPCDLLNFYSASERDSWSG